MVRHKSPARQSKNCCRKYKGKHYTSLCTAEPFKPPPPPLPPPPSTLASPALPASPPTPPTLPLSTQLNVTTPKNDVHSVTIALPTSSNTVTLLKTAIANVGTQHNYCKVNIRFNEGAQRPFSPKI